MINLKKDLIIIIPALEKNKYSLNGDLHKFGGTSLLEWKISQAKNINQYSKIIVCTPSKKIKQKCDKLGINVLVRKKTSNLSSFHKFVASKYKNKLLLYLNPTSPFLSSKIINKVILNFKKNFKKYDSACTIFENKEYFFLNKKSVNFDYNQASVSRSNISTLTNLTNGFFMISSNLSFKKSSIIGYKPLFIKLDWLSSLEIKTVNDIEAYNFLINYYFEKN
jgi:CMP-N-acetylneuraminic acid synthetase